MRKTFLNGYDKALDLAKKLKSLERFALKVKRSDINFEDFYKALMAKVFDCDKESVHIGDKGFLFGSSIGAEHDEKFEVVLGNYAVNLDSSLEFYDDEIKAVAGDLEIAGDEGEVSLPNLEYVLGDLTIKRLSSLGYSEPVHISMRNLKFIGGELYIPHHYERYFKNNFIMTQDGYFRKDCLPNNMNLGKEKN